MAHECGDCLQMCYCDGEDTYMSSSACVHRCDPADLDDDLDDVSPYDCDACEDNGCGLCMPNANEIANEQCCAAFPDCLHPISRGDRKAIEENLVGTLFPEKEENGGRS